MLERIDHVNIVAQKLETMKAFYCDILGLEVVNEPTIEGEWIDRVVGLEGVRAKVALLEAPEGPRVELIEYITPSASRPANLGEPNAPGLRHIAFRVSDIDSVVRTLRQAGIECFGQVQEVPYAQVQFAKGVRKHLVYFQDPEGNLLELCQYQ